METDHVSVGRLTQIVSYDDVSFTQREIDHLMRCAVCFNQWENVIATVLLDDTCPADAT
jgi:hypothetical protein